jgi:hypothetical protein
MKILLVCKGEYRYSFPRIAQALRRKYGCKVSAIAFNTPAARMLARTKVFEGIHNVARYLKAQVPQCDTQESIRQLLELDGAEETETLNTMVHADRILKRYPPEEIVTMLSAICDFWKSLFCEVRPDAVVSEVACATEWIGWRFAKQASIPYLVPYCASAENRFFFIGAPTGIWESMEGRYRAAKERGLSPEQIQRAEEFVRNFRLKRPKPLMPRDHRSPLYPSPRRLIERLARAPFRVQTYLEDGRYEVGSYHGTPPWEPVWEDARRILRHAICETAVFETQPREGPAVYFPLHMQPEFTTDVRAPFHTNQHAIVENICRSVPLGYWVLVKEHPIMKGQRPVRYYRELKKFYNVQLLSPSVDSHDLIQQSNAVLTITGSAAWEAILYEKPAIAFGPLCYGFYDLVYHCGDVADLPATLREARQRFRPDHELLLKFVWAFLDSAYELEWGDPIRSPSLLEDENIDRTADAIFAEISLRERSRTAETVLT